jgi:hypothetical protein
MSQRETPEAPITFPEVAADSEQRTRAQTGEVYQLRNYAGHFTDSIPINHHGGSKDE